MKILKTFFLGTFLVAFLCLPLSLHATTKTQTNNVNQNLTNNKTFNSFINKSGFKDVRKSNESLTTVIGNIVADILSLVGIIFAILIIYGGIRWMTAGGDSGRVDKAKNIIINSVIGLVITMSAYAISSAIVSILLTSTTN